MYNFFHAHTIEEKETLRKISKINVILRLIAVLAVVPEKARNFKMKISYSAKTRIPSGRW